MTPEEVKEIVAKLEKPNDPYREDLKVIRKGLIYLLNKDQCVKEKKEPKKGEDASKG